MATPEPSISLLPFLSEHVKLMVEMFLASYLNSYLMMLKFTIWPVASKAFPSVIASSVCWSLQCLVSALTQRGRWRILFFFLVSLVQLRCGEGGRDAANK